MPNSNQANHTYKLVEIVGTSPESFAAAARNGVERASKSLRNLDWFEVTEMRETNRGAPPLTTNH